MAECRQRLMGPPWRPWWWQAVAAELVAGTGRSTGPTRGWVLVSSVFACFFSWHLGQKVSVITYPKARTGWGGAKHRPSNKEGGRPTKGTTTDRHEHTPPHWPQNRPTGKRYFCLYLTSEVGSSNYTRPMQGPRQAVCLPGQNFTGSDGVSPPRRAGLGPSRLACHPLSQAWHKALEPASTPVGCPVPRQ